MQMPGRLLKRFIRIQQFPKNVKKLQRQQRKNKFMDKERKNMKANRHTSLGLSDEDVLEMYRYMLLARKLDERMWLLNRSGKINFVVSGQGQEAAQIGAGFALDRTKDYIAPYYRDLGLVLYYGMTTKDIMLSAFGKHEDPNSAGRQ